MYSIRVCGFARNKVIQSHIKTEICYQTKGTRDIFLFICLSPMSVHADCTTATAADAATIIESTGDSARRAR